MSPLKSPTLFIKTKITLFKLPVVVFLAILFVFFDQQELFLSLFVSALSAVRVVLFLFAFSQAKRKKKERKF